MPKDSGYPVVTLRQRSNVYNKGFTIMKLRQLAATFAAFTLIASTSAIADHPSHTLFPNHDYSSFSLPAVGDSDDKVLQAYGQPTSRQSGGNGVDVWDYGSFRVIFRNSTVSYAAMW